PHLPGRPRTPPRPRHRARQHLHTHRHPRRHRRRGPRSRQARAPRKTRRDHRRRCPARGRSRPCRGPPHHARHVHAFLARLDVAQRTHRRWLARPPRRHHLHAHGRPALVVPRVLPRPPAQRRGPLRPAHPRRRLH